MLKKDNDTFIKESIIIHGNKFDYSLVNYTGARTYVKIICPVHGVFEQTPTGHLSGRGCYKCSGKMRKSDENFIKKATIVHNNRYDYSLVNYQGKDKKIKIICPVHGIFEQSAKSHLNGHGCHYCFESIKKTNEEFINELEKIHNGRFDYSMTKYDGAFKKIKLICKEHNTVFETTPHRILRQKIGCPLCVRKNIRFRKIKRAEKNRLNGHQLMPAFNVKACEMFNDMNKKENINIQHAMNGGEYYIKDLGYWLDGYDAENNVAYEYYEKHHYNKGKLRIKDVIREKEICDFLKCKIIIINDLNISL